MNVQNKDLAVIKPIEYDFKNMIPALNWNEPKIKKLNDDCFAIVVSDVNDKPNYIKAKAQLQVAIHARTGMGKFRKHQQVDIKDFIERANQQEKDFKELMSEGELHLRAQLKIVDDEVIRLEKVKLEKERKFIADRISELITAGAIFDRYGDYTITIKGSDPVEVETIEGKSISLIEPEIWKESVATISAINENNLALIAKEKKDQEDEAKRVADIAADQKIKDDEQKVKDEELAERERKIKDTEKLQSLQKVPEPEPEPEQKKPAKSFSFGHSVPIPKEKPVEFQVISECDKKKLLQFQLKLASMEFPECDDEEMILMISGIKKKIDEFVSRIKEVI